MSGPIHTTALTASSRAARARAPPAALKLLLSPSAPAHKAQKIKIAAALAGVRVDAATAKSDAELAAACPHARTVVLSTKDGPVTRSDAVLRYVAALNPAAELAGSTTSFRRAELLKDRGAAAAAMWIVRGEGVAPRVPRG